MELIRYFVSGGAGFIGSSLIHRLLKNQQDIEIVCYDNLSVGKLEYLNDIKNDPRLKIFIANIQDTRFLVKCMNGCDIVYHFASNSDISKAMTEPSIDFYEGTLLTFYILEAMRINKVKRIIYASGSGVYGFTGLFKNTENETLQPASPYGASKMAGEGLISAYCHLFNMQGAAYRFANVIGKNSTHGVIKDFIEKLKNNPNELLILGNGCQEKGYMYIDDILDGIESTCFQYKSEYEVFNLASDDLVTVNQIADMIVEKMEINKPKYKYTGGFGGWKGDVPQIAMSSEKAKMYGWKPKYTAKEAVRKSIIETLENY